MAKQTEHNQLKVVENMEDNTTFILVDNKETLVKAEAALAGCKRVAFDSEGIDLGRRGPLTLASFCSCDGHGKGPTIVYIVDVQTLGGLRVFGTDIVVSRHSDGSNSNPEVADTSSGHFSDPREDVSKAIPVESEAAELELPTAKPAPPLKQLLENP